MVSKNSAIGVMDSGVGGLTVVKAIESMMPGEDIIFYGDSANCPYGNRTEEVIEEFAEGIIHFLEQHDVKAIAVACNTMSTIIDKIKGKYDIEIIGIVDPAAHHVARIAPSDVGVVATVFTISTKEYDKLIDKYDGSIKVVGQGSPSLAALIESGEFDYTKIDAEIKKEVGTILEKDPQIKHIVLGCTHYPIVLDRFQKLYPSITFINPAVDQAMSVRDYLTKNHLLSSKEKGDLKIFTSGNTEKFAMMAEKLSLFTPVEIGYDKFQ